MNKDIKFKELIKSSFKGITPKYVEKSSIMVLNQKCIRNNAINYSLAQYHSDDKAVPENKFLKVGDILINSTGQGTAGRCAFVKELPENQLVTIDSHILVVRMSDFYTAGFAEYHLYNIEKLLQTFMDGSTGQGEFDKQRLYNVFVRLPSENRRKSIYELLSEIDEKIALNNQINATLEQMAKTLYDYWFVQFDFPDDNGKPYKSSGGEMVYNDVLKREIPIGWEVGVLGEIISLTRGLTYDKSEICKPNFKNSVGVLRATNVSGNVVDIDDLVYVSKNVSSNQIINQSNILIVMSSGSKEHIGKNGVYYFDENNAFGAFCSKVVPKIGFQNFVTAFLQSESFKSYVKTQCLGTNINNLNNSQITDCPIIKPDKTISHKFEDIVGKNFEVIKNNFLTNHELTRLRDWLLPMLMNGQVTVQ